MSIHKWTHVTIIEATQVIMTFCSFCSGTSDSD